MVVSGDQEGNICLHSLTTNALIDKFVASNAAVRSISNTVSSYSPSCFCFEHNNAHIPFLVYLCLLMAFRGVFLYIYIYFCIQINEVRFSPLKNSWFAIADDDGSISVWSSKDRKRKAHFHKQHSAPATGIAFSPTHKSFMCSCGLDSKLQFYDIEQKAYVITFRALLIFSAYPNASSSCI
jgi:WD40 repeat protein